MSSILPSVTVLSTPDRRNASFSWRESTNRSSASAWPTATSVSLSLSLCSYWMSESCCWSSCSSSDCCFCWRLWGELLDSVRGGLKKLCVALMCFTSAGSTCNPRWIKAARSRWICSSLVIRAHDFCWGEEGEWVGDDIP